MAILSRLKALLFVLMLLVTSFFGTLCVNGVLFPLLLIRPVLYRKLFDICNGIWEWQTAFLLEKFIGMKVVISGDEIQSDEQSVIVMNHRTCFDWMYFWSLLVRHCGVFTEKIIVKSSLRHLPGPGWAMQAATFLFVDRKWDEDEKHLKQMIDFYAMLNYRTQILIFPEGTDFTAESKQRSDRFAEKNGLQPFSYVLHPRTTGFTFLVPYLRKHWQKVALYDVTIAYPSSFPQNEVELIKGRLPREVHFQVRRYSPTDIPESEEDLAKWCKDRWIEKERRLKFFYSTGQFPCEKPFRPDTSEGSPKPKPKPLWYIETCLYLAMTVWLVGVVLAVCSLIWWPFVRVVFICQIIIFFVLWFKGSGYDVVQAAYVRQFFSHVSK